MTKFFFASAAPLDLEEAASGRRYWLVGEGKMRAEILKMAEAWAHQAGLSAGAVKQFDDHITEALAWCIFYLWAAEEV